MSWITRGARAYVEDAPVLAAAALAALGAATIALGQTGWWESLVPAGGGTAPGWWHLGPLLLASAASLARRSRPDVTLAVAVVAVALDGVIGGSLAGVLVVLDALYVTERFGAPRLRRAAHVAAAVVALAVTGATIAVGLELRDVLSTAFQVAGVLVVPFAWGAAVRSGQERAATAETLQRVEAERAAALARAATAESTAAVRHERTRMAQELHDSVAGDLSAVVIQASAALAATRDAARDTDALTAVRASGVHALGELRTMIDVLRLPADDSGAPAPGGRLTRDAGDLVRGLVRVDVSGTDLTGVALDEDVDRAGYRILQEALTNVAKHARSPRARVTASLEPGALTLAVASALPAPAPRPGGAPVDAGGLGLPGIRSRATAVGGTAQAGPDGESWVVRVRLPLAGGAS